MDISDSDANELDRLAREETPTANCGLPLRNAERITQLLGARLRSGPAFEFPKILRETSGEAIVEDEAELNHHFSGWVPGELAAGGAPAIAIRENDHPVSVCFCARRSAVAAEAGIETATEFRGRGYAARVALAWATHVRAEGLIPLYSTDWSNLASLAVARKLALIPYATDFNFEI